MVLASPAFKVKLYVPFARAGLAADAQAARQLLRQELRQGEVPDARPRAHRELRRRSADHAGDLGHVLLGLYDAAERVVADAQAIVVPTQLLDLRRRLGRAPRAAARVLRPARIDGQGAPRAAGLPPRHAGRARSRARRSTRVRAFLLRRSRSRSRRRTCATRHARLHARGSRRAGRAAAAAVAARPVLGRHARQPALRRGGSPTACASATRPDSIPAARSTTSTATGARGHAARARSSTATISTPIGWRGIRQRKLHLEELLRKAIADRRAAGAPVRIVDIAAGHGRYVLDAIDRCGARPIPSCCATTASSTSSRAPR